MSKWYVLCDVCGRKIYNVDSYKRWDGMIVCPNDYESKHPSLTYRPKVGGGGAIPAGSIGTTGDEDTAQSILVCDVYTSMGVVGYGTTGCARSGTYNRGLSPLPSLTIVPIRENPIVDPSGDSFIDNVVLIMNFQGTVGTYTFVDTSAFNRPMSKNGTGADPVLSNGDGIAPLSLYAGQTSMGKVQTIATSVIKSIYVSDFSVPGITHAYGGAAPPLGPSAFTYECFIYLPAVRTSTVQLYYGIPGGGITIDTLNNIVFNTNVTGFVGGTVPVDQWIHIAMCHSNNLTIIRGFADGTCRVNQNYPGQDLNRNINIISGQYGGSQTGDYYIGGIRHTWGVARYTGTTAPVTTYPVPGAPFPNFRP